MYHFFYVEIYLKEKVIAPPEDIPLPPVGDRTPKNSTNSTANTPTNREEANKANQKKNDNLKLNAKESGGKTKKKGCC